MIERRVVWQMVFFGLAGIIIIVLIVIGLPMGGV
jgi:hypothetical protein